MQNNKSIVNRKTNTKIWMQNLKQIWMIYKNKIISYQMQ